MKFGTAIGIVISIVGIAIGATMEGTNVMVVLNIPAISIVLIGTLGATIAACGLEAHIRLPAIYKKAIMPDDLDLPGRVKELVGFAEQARRDGLLALDEAVSSISDPFTRKGIQLVVDGTDPDLVAAVLDAENEAMRKRHAAARNPFMQAGALAPTMGIIGTVFGLVNVMNNLNNPSSLGPLIAGAFVATLWGVLSANIFWLPMGAKITRISDLQAAQMELLVEGITEIQAGTSPRAVRQKLTSLVPPSEVEREAA